MKFKQGQMRIGGLIIALLLVVALVAGITDLLVEFSKTYGTETYAGNLSKFTAQEGQLKNIVGNVSNETFGGRVFTPVGFFTEGAFTSVSTAKRSIGVMNAFLQAVQEDIGLPLWLIGFITSAIVIFVAFVVLSAIFRSRGV